MLSMSLYLFKDGRFTDLTTAKNIRVKGRKIPMHTLGYNPHNRYLFHADFSREGFIDYAVYGTFDRQGFQIPGQPYRTPPYSTLLFDDFVKDKKGNIYYHGGFSIV